VEIVKWKMDISNALVNQDLKGKLVKKVGDYV
jgi:hypothetical protein